MKRAFLWITRIVIGIGLLATAVGGAYAIDPTLFDYFFEFIGLTPEEIGNITYGIGGLTGLGVVAKVLKLSVNTDTMALQVHNEKIISQYKAELEKERENHALEINALNEKYANQYDELKQEMAQVKNTNALILQGQVMSAERIKNYTFTSDEDTKQAEEFISKVKGL